MANVHQFDVVVVGAGGAGLMAGLYASRTAKMFWFDFCAAVTNTALCPLKRVMWVSGASTKSTSAMSPR